MTEPSKKKFSYKNYMKNLTKQKKPDSEYLREQREKIAKELITEKDRRLERI